jgi:hypothetical protein
MTVRPSPVAWLVTAICAPATNPPLGSNTVPESPPVPAVWAKQHFNWGRALINMRIATDRMAMDKALGRVFVLIAFPLKRNREQCIPDVTASLVRFAPVAVRSVPAVISAIFLFTSAQQFQRARSLCMRTSNQNRAKQAHRSDV